MLVMIFQSLVNTSEGQLKAVGLAWLNPDRNQKCLNTAHSDPVKNFLLPFDLPC